MSLDVSRDGDIAVVTLSNPRRRNAITHDMWRAVPELLDGLATDAGVRVVVLTGAGDDFSAGADLGDLNSAGQTSISSAADVAMAGFAKPMVAAIRGYCLGGGCQLALGCDLRVAGRGAKFGVPPANLGLVYPLTGLRNLVAAVGVSGAKRLVYTGARVDAEEALRIRLVDEVVADDQVLDRTLELARRISSRSMVTVHATKAMVAALDRPDADDVADHWLRTADAAGDLAEGLSAFAARREPDFVWNGTGQGS